MKICEEFDLNEDAVRPLGRELMTIPPYILEKLSLSLKKKGYTVLRSSAQWMGIPKSITIIKNFKGTFAAMFSEKMKEDFADTTSSLGVNNLFV